MLQYLRVSGLLLLVSARFEFVTPLLCFIFLLMEDFDGCLFGTFVDGTLIDGSFTFENYLTLFRLIFGLMQPLNFP